MNLVFDTIEVSNFKAFNGTHSFPLQELGIGLHFVVGENLDEPKLGSNGSAKSTLVCDALSWGLYGKTPSGLKNTDILPWNGNKPASVKTTVLVNNKRNIIHRTANPNFLSLNGEECNQVTINNLLQLSFEIFSQAVLLGQGQPLFFDLAPKAKMELFAEVLNLSRWDDRSEFAGKAVTDLAHQEAAGQAKLAALSTGASQLEKLLSEALRGAETWSKERSTRLRELRAALMGARKEQDKLETERTTFDLEYDGACTELKALENRSDKQSKVWQGLVEARNKAMIQVGIFTSEMHRLNQELAILGSSNECPTCGQSIKGTNLEKHKAEITKEYNKVSKSADDWLSDANEEQKEIDRVRAQLDASLKHKKDFQLKIDLARVARDDKARDFNRIAAKASSLQDQIKQIDEESNPYRVQVQQLRSQIQESDSKISQQEELLQELKATIDQTKPWIKGFKDIRLYVMEEVLKELELTTNSMLEEMGLQDWIVTYNIERETKAGTTSRGLNVTIMSPRSKNDVKWESWSG